jgi:phenylalanyl-tRNA synthetase alpha chain
VDDLLKQINAKSKEFCQLIEDLNDLQKFKELKNSFKSYVKELYSYLKSAKSEEKKILGQAINDFKNIIQKKLDLMNQKFEIEGSSRNHDPTIFKSEIKFGTIHPLIKLYKKIENILFNMGFSIAQGPEIELDRYNFEKLNMPPYHPARDMQDTFYIFAPQVLLRSHTSSVQIRTLENISPPLQIISPGTVYRVDDIDPQHTPMFYQVEGLVVSENVSFANLKSVLITLLKKIFGDEIMVRFRPSYYPYTEPSAAIDMSCTKCGGDGCQVCSGSGWITVLGSGMVHPAVLKGVNIDPLRYSGFAFGLGLNRLALLYYDLGEIRKLYENDISLWKQL